MSGKEDLHRPLQSGILIKGRNGNHPNYQFNQGTLAALATRSGAKVLVTNMHVMAGLTADDNFRNPAGSEQMYQGGSSSGFKVGDIIDWQRTPANSDEYMEIDAAICDLDPSSASGLGALYKLHDEPHGTRSFITGTKEPVNGLPVVLLGAKTGEIPGTIDVAGIDDDFGGAEFRNLFTISLDADTTAGNSGAPTLYKVETGVY